MNTVLATHLATGSTYYLTGFETLNGRTRATFSSMAMHARAYANSKAAAKAAIKWSVDAYSATAFSDFRAV